MGMFDTVYCKFLLPLPAPDWAREASRDYQTKSLDCELDVYTITFDGRLEKECHEYEWVDDTKDIFGGHLQSTEQWIEVIPYHGDVEFHDIGPNDEWIQFRARFSYGKLDSITLERLDKPT